MRKIIILIIIVITGVLSYNKLAKTELVVCDKNKLLTCKKINEVIINEYTKDVISKDKTIKKLRSRVKNLEFDIDSTITYNNELLEQIKVLKNPK